MTQYPRREFLAEGVPTRKIGSPYAKGPLTVPLMEYPISIRENFELMANHQNPMWLPNSDFEVTQAMVSMLCGYPDADFTSTERHDFTDWFGCIWTFVPEAGGPMLKPGTQLLDDITKWEEVVKFPNLDEYDIEGCCKAWKEKFYDPNKILVVDMLQSCTERLVAVMGGYTDAMPALLEEPEAVLAFHEAVTDFNIAVFDRLNEQLDIDIVQFHDDWGTERSTFFSPQVMEDLVFEPTKRLFQHIKSKGVRVQLHSCGHIQDFVPYMIDAGADFIQIQPRANDMKFIKDTYGDKVGINYAALLDDVSPEKTIEEVHYMVDNFAKNGGFYACIKVGRDEAAWAGVEELQCYSREYYDSQK